MNTTNLQIQVSPFDQYFGTIVEPTGDTALADLPRDEMIELYKSAGMLYFRGFNAEVEDFESFSNRFTTDFMDYQGGGYKRRVINEAGDKSIMSVNYDIGKSTQGMFALPLHGEMYYVKNRPAAIWFYCVVPAAQDGETTVCEGSQIYEELSESTKRLFAEKQLKYIRYYDEADWVKRFQTTDLSEVRKFCDENDYLVKIDHDQRTVYTEYLHPATITHKYTGRTIFINNILPVVWQERNGKTTNVVRLEDGSEIPEDVIAEIQGVVNRLIRKIPWRAGDIALIDNARILHGRAKFQDDNRELFSRMVRSVDF